jgi:hypothetical protein
VKFAKSGREAGLAKRFEVKMSAKIFATKLFAMELFAMKMSAMKIDAAEMFAGRGGSI